MTVEKPKPKQLLRPITTGADSTMNQSQFLAITCNSLEAREKSRVQGAIGFGFASHWLKNWRESFKPITKRSNRNHVITFDSHLKTALTAQCFVIIPCWLHCGEWPKCAFICLVGMIFIWRERKKDACSAAGLLCPQDLKFENFTSSLFISWIKDATFFSHGRKPEVDISQCSLLDFQRNCLYLWKDTWRCENSSHPLTFPGWKMSHAWDPSYLPIQTERSETRSAHFYVVPNKCKVSLNRLFATSSFRFLLMLPLFFRSSLLRHLRGISKQANKLTVPSLKSTSQLRG